jgi:SPP1 family predicted phage head-tail adaptor
MRAGRLRERVTIQTQVEGVEDTFGAPAMTWSDVATVWAEVMVLSGREAFRMAQVQPEATLRVVMRYRAGVTSQCRLQWGDLYLYPLSVTYDQKQTELTLLCSQRD